MPFCLQCSHDPSQCHYPEENKRGLPLGYVNKLEARLAETEGALFRALHEKHTGTYADMSVCDSSSNKADRVSEWDGLPLRTAHQTNLWYQSKLRGLESSEATSPSATTSSAISHQTSSRRGSRRQLPREQRVTARHQRMNHAREMLSRAHPEAVPENPLPPVGEPMELVSGSVPTDEEPSRAKILSQAQGHVYF